MKAPRKAVEVDPAGHLSQFALAQVHFNRRDRDASFSAAHKAVQLNPNDCTTMAMTGLLTAYAGEREEEAHAAVESLLQLFPDYAVRARDELGKWFLTTSILEHVLEGLRKAGLMIPED